MSVRHLVASGSLLLGLSGAALAQTAPVAPGASPSSAPVVVPQSGSTGAPNAATISPNGNPADTITTDSAAGGNAGQPSRAIPQGGGSTK
ncbi:hypothetical protein [Methylobacterium sp. J-076]|uniref:hypothetical protein n=1 Tax=Methylobacterium sp. J-076 TaxID=2836655 RepID=UPI001FB86815|nr:hypothetical protein [Methylobacterium sp. J-076]MCJ2011236.1 hypothetical protein [Methylobacterium sp. J-076]